MRWTLFTPSLSGLGSRAAFMDTANPICNGLSTNPDINGVGVRHSFYFQNGSLLALLLLNSGRKALPALQIFLWTSFGLTVAAVIQALFGELSFLEALQVSNLIWFTNFSSFLAVLYLFRSNKSMISRNYTLQIAAIAHNLVSMILTLVMWSNPAQFLAQHECVQDVEYGIFAFRVPARGPVRIACLTVTSCLLLAYSVFAFYELRSLHRIYRGNNQVNNLDSDTIWRIDLPMPSTAQISQSSPMVLRVGNPDSRNHSEPYMLTLAPCAGNPSEPTSHSSSYDDISKPLRSEKLYSRGEIRWGFGPFTPFLLIIMASYSTAFAYLIASTEAMIYRNPKIDNGPREWGFGQILAIVVVIPTVLSVLREFVIALRRRTRNPNPVQLSLLHRDYRQAGHERSSGLRNNLSHS